MCNKASNEGRDKQANSVEREKEPNTYCVSQEEESLQKVYLQQLKEGNSQNPTVTLNINGIPFSLHLDTQADVTVITEKRYGKIQATCTLQPTGVAIRSYSGEGKGPVLPLLGKFAATTGREGDGRACIRGQRSGRHYVAEPSGRGTYGPGRISPGSDLEHAFTCHGRE